MARQYFVLLIFICTSCPGAGYAQTYALRGDKVPLKPDITAIHHSTYNILWKHNGNKVVEFSGQVEEVYGTYKDRITLDRHSAELKITELQYNDSGLYEVEVFLEETGLQRFSYQLEVLDRVSKPNISCEINDGSSSNNGPVSGSLLCSAEPRPPLSPLTYVWTSHGKVVHDHRLSISLGDEYDDDVYICNVSNPLSSETASFTAKDCYPESSSTALTVSLVITFITIISIILGILYCKIKHKACFAEGQKNDSEKQSYNATEGSAGPPPDEDEGTMPFLPTANGRESDGYDKAQFPEIRPTPKPRSSIRTHPPNVVPTDTADEHKEETQTSGDNQQPVSEGENQPEIKGGGGPLPDKDEETKPLLPADSSHKDANSHQTSAGTTENNNLISDSSSWGIKNRPESNGYDKAQFHGIRPTPRPRSSIRTHPPKLAPTDTADEHKEEAQTSGDNQQETSKPVSVDENQPGNLGDNKEIENLPLATSQQPQRPKPPPKPDRTARKRFAESPNTAHVGQDQGQDPGYDKAQFPEIRPTLKPRPSIRTHPPHVAPTDTADEHKKETQTSGDNQQETSKPVSEDENQPGNVGDNKEIENLPLATSQHPKRPKLSPKPDMMASKTSPNTKHIGQGQDAEPVFVSESVSGSEADGDEEAQPTDASRKTHPTPKSRLLSKTPPPANEPERETNTREDNQEATSKAVSENVNGAKNVGDDEEMENEKASQQPLSSTPIKPDKNSQTSQESPNTGHVDPDSYQSPSEAGSVSENESAEDEKEKLSTRNK